MSGILLKKAGLIGGVSWHSTVELYRLINTYVAEKLGGLNSAEVFVASINLNRITSAATDAEKAAVLAEAAKSLEMAGADFIAVGSNGLHQYKDRFMEGIPIPFLHIADCVAAAVTEKGFHTVGLLGVQETMRDDFYISHLSAAHIQTIVPDEDDCTFVNRVLFEETGKGIVKKDSAHRFYEIAGDLYRQGAQGIILGCTEIGMLMHQSDTAIPLFDSMQIYAKAIAEKCMEVGV